MMRAEGVGELEPQCRKRWDMRVVTLKRRSEFLRVRGGPRWSSKNLVIETRSGSDRPARDRDPINPRFGFTITKKLGGAVVRNRIRRRLKEAIRSLPPGLAEPGHDYVLIARIAALTCGFEQLKQELAQALRHVHRKGRRHAGESSASQARDPSMRGRNHRSARARGQSS